MALNENSMYSAAELLYTPGGLKGYQCINVNKQKLSDTFSKLRKRDMWVIF